MKKLLFVLLACCLLLCGCEKEKPNNDPLLSVRWETGPCRGIPADVVSMRCSEENAAEVEKKLEEALTDFPCRTREEVTACAWALCGILIENDCLDTSWVPVKAAHYTDGIWLVGFASVRDREMLRDHEAQRFDLTMFELLSYDGMRCLNFTPAQPEVYLASDTLPEQPYTIDWLDVAPETLTFQKDGQKVTLTLRMPRPLTTKSCSARRLPQARRSRSRTMPGSAPTPQRSARRYSSAAILPSESLSAGPTATRTASFGCIIPAEMTRRPA